MQRGGCGVGPSKEALNEIWPPGMPKVSQTSLHIAFITSTTMILPTENRKYLLIRTLIDLLEHTWRMSVVTFDVEY